MNLQTQPVMETIIENLSTSLKLFSCVRAFWLVGSLAKETVDKYSDLDFWIDFSNEAEEKVFDSVELTLSSIAAIDYRHKKTVSGQGVPHITNDTSLTVHKRIYHLEGTSEHLRITFSWQEHNNLKREYKFDNNLRIEPAKVLFDKDSVISHLYVNPLDFKNRNKLLLEEAIYCRNRQEAFIEKNTTRLWYMVRIQSLCTRAFNNNFTANLYPCISI